MRFQKIIVYGGLFLDIIGIAIFIPVLPELKAFYSINDLQVSLGLTLYALFAFFATPVLGQLSDKLGRKRLLSWCVGGTVVSYAVLLLSQHYWIFLASRIINGITGGNIAILQATLADLSEDETRRTKNFGFMGALFSIGFIVGPLLGSLLLSLHSVENIFRFGLFFSSLELVGIIRYLQNTNNKQHDKKISYNIFQSINKYLHKKTLKSLLLSFFFLGIGGFIINATLSLFMHDTFGLSGKTFGYILACSGLINAINLGFFMPKFWLKHFSSQQLIIRSHIVMILGYSVLGYIKSLRFFLMIFYIVMILGGVYMPLYTTKIVGQAQKGETGEVSGMLASAQSLFMFLGPLIGGTMLHMGMNIFIGTVICFMCSAVFMYYGKSTQK